MTKPDKIADAAEVLEYLTARMRGDAESNAATDEVEGKKPRRRTDGTGGLKAAELLAKRYGLLGERPAAAAEVPRIIDDIAPDEGTEGEEGGVADE